MATKTVSTADIPVRIDPKAEPFLKGADKEAMETLIATIKETAVALKIRLQEIYVEYDAGMKKDGMPFVVVNGHTKDLVLGKAYKAWMAGVFDKMETWFGSRGKTRQRRFFKIVLVSLGQSSHGD